MATITANGSKGHHKFTLEVVESNYDVNANTSDVSFTFKISPIQSGYNWSGWGSYISYTITIDGTNYTGTIASYNGSSTVTLKTGSKTGISHNNDGTKTISFNFTVSDTSGQSYTCGNATKSGSLVLTTIPRASQIGVTNADIGSSTNITINKASNEFTTTLYYKASGQNSWTKIVDKTALQVYAWTVPTSFYALTPNSKTITCQFYADTYNGDMFIGNSSIVTATFTATGNPTISNIVAKDINATTIALTGNDETMVKYASNVRVTVTASGQNSATISSIKVNGVTAIGGVVTFNGATTNTYQVVVTDSRGYTTSQTKTMIGANYIPLTINQTIARNQPTDNKVNINFSGNYYSGTFGATTNTLTVEYRYKEKSSATWGNWTTLTATVSGTTYSGTEQISNIDYTKIYDFEIRAKDKVYSNGEKTITGITVSKGTPVFNWDDDEFDVNVETKLDKTLQVGKYIKDVIVESVKAKNLFNQYKRINDTYVGSIASCLSNYTSSDMYGRGYFNANWTLSNDANWFIGFTPCESGKTYTISNSAGTMSCVAFINSSGTITANSNDWVTSYTHTATSSEVYIILGANKSALGSIQIEEGNSKTTLKEYKEYGYVRGNNSNGSYIKYDDGTLIQWNRIEVDNQAISSAYGSLYQGTRYLTFPIPFVGDMPSCQCTEFQWGSGASWGTIANVTLTNITCRGIDITSRSTGTKCRIGWFAIGRWK